MECLRSLVSAMMSVIVLSALGAEAESCVNNSVWGPCTSGNLGFRHPLYDTLFAIQVEENGAGIRIDGYLDDWAEHPLDYR